MLFAQKLLVFFFDAKNGNDFGFEGILFQSWTSLSFSKFFPELVLTNLENNFC